MSQLLLILVVVSLLALVIVDQSRRLAKGPQLSVSPGLSDEQLKGVLRDLEAAAPHLFQLRKVGFRLQVTDELRQRFKQIDAAQATRVLNFLDGNVTL